MNHRKLYKPAFLCFFFIFLYVGVKEGGHKKEPNYHNTTKFYKYKSLQSANRYWLNQWVRELTSICFLFHNSCSGRIFLACRNLLERHELKYWDQFQASVAFIFLPEILLTVRKKEIVCQSMSKQSMFSTKFIKKNLVKSCCLKVMLGKNASK